jgi:hypothetical protein
MFLNMAPPQTDGSLPRRRGEIQLEKEGHFNVVILQDYHIHTVAKRGALQCCDTAGLSYTHCCKNATYSQLN